MAKKPYEGDTLSTFEIQLKIVQEALEKTHSNWDPIIEKATAKNEKDRYASCSAWLKELNQGLQESPIPSKNEATVIDRFDATDKTLIEQDLTKDIMLEVSMLASDGTLRYGFVDVKGNWLIQPMFEAVGYFDKQGYCKATINTKEGFIDKNGNWRIQPIYDNLLEFDENGYAEAKINDKVGFIDRSGKWVIQPAFDSLQRFDEKGYCCATVNDKVGIINRAGNWVVQPMFDHVYYLADDQGYREVELNGKFGFIDESGQWMIQAKFDLVGRFDVHGYAEATHNGKVGFINRSGNWIIQPLFDEVRSFENQDLAPASLNEKWGFIDRKGIWIIQPIFDRIYNNFDTQGFAQVSLNEKWGFIGKNGNWIIQPMFDALGLFDEEDYAYARMNGKGGCIDRRGNWIIQPIFEDLYSFDDSGIASVTKDEKSGFIDRKGNWILQTSVKINYFNPIGNHGFIIGVDSKYGIIDRKGNWIVQPTFIIDQIIHNQIIRVSENNKFGFVDVYGNWIIPPRFDYIYTDIWVDEPFFWNEETKDWEFNNSSESGYSDIDDETIEGYFSHLVGKEKVFLSDNLPANKLKNFINQFNAGFFSEGNVVVYYDDTLWGKGDNGFLIYRCEFNRLYLFINDFAGEKLGFCFENDQVNPILLSSTYLVKDKKLQLTYQDQEGEEKILEWINSNAATLALDTFIQENT
jgi:hypothetical protein